MSTQLDSFETRLLDELDAFREQVVGASGRRRTTRRRIVAGAGVAAAAVAGVLVIPGLGPTAAYSVSEGNSGQITVEVRRLEDASGLEEALAEHGVVADIRYLPYGQACAAGRYVAVERRLTGMGAALGSSILRIVLPPGAVRDGETFVMWVSGREMTADEMAELEVEEGTTVTQGFHSRVDFDVAAGPVKPCDVVPAARSEAP